MANEKRLIDANAWESFYKELAFGLDHYNPYEHGFGDAADRVDDWFDAQPIVDAVEVVRCKDCKCGKHPESTLMVGKYVNCALYDPMPMMRCNDFCSYGERKDNG